MRAPEENDDDGSPPGAPARAELLWAVASLVVAMGSLVGVVIFTAVHWASAPPAGIETVNPLSLNVSGEFIEPNLGAQQAPDGSITVRIVAQQYAFNPQCLVLPAGRRITFRGTSADAVHGLLVTGTNANAMLVPGYVTSFTTVFAQEGEHLVPCHEFCGTGHAAMWAHLRIISPKAFQRLLETSPGGRCA